MSRHADSLTAADRALQNPLVGGAEEPEIQDTRPALEQWASALTKDPAQAATLVTQTLARLEREVAPGGEPLSDVRLYRALRESYHSIERSRGHRPPREAIAASLANAGQPTTGATPAAPGRVTDPDEPDQE